MIKLFSTRMAGSFAVALLLGVTSVSLVATFDSASAFGRGNGGSSGGAGSGGGGGPGAGARDTTPIAVYGGHCRENCGHEWRRRIIVRQDTVCRNGVQWTQDINGSWLRVSCEPSMHGYEASE